jgi:hypothetical protein
MKTTIDMAREAGLLTWLKPPEDVIERFKAFEALVRADERNRTWTQEHWTEYEQAIVQAEREACAVIAETAADYLQNSTFQGVANAIRARSQA